MSETWRMDIWKQIIVTLQWARLTISGWLYFHVRKAKWVWTYGDDMLLAQGSGFKLMRSAYARNTQSDLLKVQGARALNSNAD